MRKLLLCTLILPLISACAASVSVPPEAQAVKQRFSSYTLSQAASDGYGRDQYCLDAASLGASASRGAMGFHSTNETLLRGPISAERPQAFMFDAQGNVLGVEYEVVADAVSQAPRLFERTFAKLSAHPGVDYDHYALHFWFVDNPSGPFDDFNPSVSCPAGSTPPAAPGHGGH
ncbi:MAG: hypothetical protein EXR58_08800 [Chloroflexi bacterium]|nr:hypothetical protein [Chloroflexota bacterium]